VVRTTGGDDFFVSFEMPDDAIGCAVAIQRSFHGHRREQGSAPLRERLAELGPLEDPDAQFERWRHKTERTLRRTLGDDQKLVEKFENITWYMSMIPGIMGKDAATGILDAAIYELEELRTG
jgi:hypothetical protein